MNDSNGQQISRAQTRVSIACVQCRSKHLRCDSVKPICGRCRVDNVNCTWVKSRRGGRTKLPHSFAAQSSTGEPWHESLGHSSRRERGLQAAFPPDGNEGLYNSTPGSSSNEGSPETTSQNASLDSLLDLYYEYFHPPHPCVFPLHVMRQKINSDIPGMNILRSVIKYIGSLYSPCIQSAPLKEAVENAFLVESGPGMIGPLWVQSLLLYAVALYWSDETVKADSLLQKTIDEALRLGMHETRFAEEHSDGDPVIAESWRRTWWQVYLTEAHCAANTRKGGFRTSMTRVVATVDLPCEEAEYSSGSIPIPRTLSEYDDREFAIDGPNFSSFAQLIGLMRGIDLAVISHLRDSSEKNNQICMNADASKAAWLSLLPKAKRKLIHEDGTVDELIMRACFGLECYTADIHRALSTLKYHPIEAVSTCSPPPPPERLEPIYQRDAHIHTAKIIQAGIKMTDLLTLPIRTATLSPSTICSVAVVTITHLSACRHVFRNEQLRAARERIRLCIGVLETFAEVWPRAKTVGNQVKTIARELLSTGSSNSSSAGASPDLDSTMTRRDLGHTAELSQTHTGLDMTSGDFSAQIPYGDPNEAISLAVTQAQVDHFFSGQSLGYFEFPHGSANSGSALEMGLENYDLGETSAGFELIL